MRNLSRWTKGFRTGSKILSAAVSLDMMAVILRMCEYAYLYESLSTLWWAKYNVTKADWTLFAVANILDGLALLTYGCGLFYLECYHDRGTSEELAWSLLTLFLLAGVSSESLKSGVQSKPTEPSLLRLCAAAPADWVGFALRAFSADTRPDGVRSDLHVALHGGSLCSSVLLVVSV